MIKECKLINKETTIEHIFNYLSQRYEFTIVKELGKGGFGCVKEIKIRNHKNALKVQYFPIGSEEQLKKKKKYFDREATLSQHFKHKNIVSETLTKYCINFTILYKSLYNFIILYLI